MKKSVKFLISIVLILALGSAGTFGYLYFSKDKPNNDNENNSQNSEKAVSVTFDRGNNVATVNGVSVIADDTGVRIFNEASKTHKHVFTKPVESVVFDGETAYFLERGLEDPDVYMYNDSDEEDTEYWQYCKVYSLNVQSGEVKELFETNDAHFVEIIYADDNFVYYTDCTPAEVGHEDQYTRFSNSLFRYDLKKDSRKIILTDVAWNEIVEDKMIYQSIMYTAGDYGYNPLYLYDFATDEDYVITEEQASYVTAKDGRIYFVEELWSDGDYDEVYSDFAFKSCSYTADDVRLISDLSFAPRSERKFLEAIGDKVYVNCSRPDDVPVFLYNLFDGTHKEIKEDDYNPQSIYRYGSLCFGLESLEFEGDDGRVYRDKVYLVNDTEKPEFLLDLDENTKFIKGTENGIYICTSGAEEEDIPLEIEFVPLDIK